MVVQSDTYLGPVNRNSKFLALLIIEDFIYDRIKYSYRSGKLFWKYLEYLALPESNITLKYKNIPNECKLLHRRHLMFKELNIHFI